MKYLVVVAVLIITGLLTKNEKPPQHFNKQVANQNIEEKGVATSIDKPVQKKVIPTPVKPARWTVRTSPHSKVTVEQINMALAVYQDMGLTKLGASYLVGNFISESYLDPRNCAGDGGTACGLAQWRFSRQEGMPKELVAQLKWAVEIEMPRDAARGGRHNLAKDLKDPNASAETIKLGLKRWERWGVLGGRWVYAEYIYKQFL